MKFADKIASLDMVKDYSVQIILSSGEELVIENIEGKQASLQLLQNHLGKNIETSDDFDLSQFCEYYDEWKAQPEGHHTTIAFLDRYNKEGGKMIKK